MECHLLSALTQIKFLAFLDVLVIHILDDTLTTSSAFWRDRAVCYCLRKCLYNCLPIVACVVICLLWLHSQRLWKLTFTFHFKLVSLVFNHVLQDTIEKGEKQPNLTIGILISILVVFITIIFRVLFGGKKPAVSSPDSVPFVLFLAFVMCSIWAFSNYNCPFSSVAGCDGS